VHRPVVTFHCNDACSGSSVGCVSYARPATRRPTRASSGRRSVRRATRRATARPAWAATATWPAPRACWRRPAAPVS